MFDGTAGFQSHSDIGIPVVGVDELLMDPLNLIVIIRLVMLPFLMQQQLSIGHLPHFYFG
ncbi:MAG: hypothetical protein CMM01_00510 [Rhodopirellula sp.]|nr:hypothetical protein [Rhodopirellula sp.]OUX52774.1 MAG: hypothetical protein CBE43_00130 [Rhodopirellula sp. TMED283]